MGEIKILLNCTKDTVERVEKSLDKGLGKLGSKVDALKKDMAEVKASARSAHKRIDRIDGIVSKGWGINAHPFIV